MKSRQTPIFDSRTFASCHLFCKVVIALVAIGLCTTPCLAQNNTTFDCGFTSLDVSCDAFGNNYGQYESCTFYPQPPISTGGNISITYLPSSNSFPYQFTVIWNTSTKNWISLTFKSNQNAVLATWADATGQGHPGSLVKTSGSFLGTIVFVDSQRALSSSYTQGDVFLEPAQTPDIYQNTGFQPDIQTFHYNGNYYQSYSSGVDYQGNYLNLFQSSAGDAQLRYNGMGLLQIGLLGVKTITYKFNGSSFAYDLQDTATGNTLTDINGYSFAAASTALGLTAPRIRSFMWDDGISHYNGSSSTAIAYTFQSIVWMAGQLNWKYANAFGGSGYALQDSGGAFQQLAVGDVSRSETITPTASISTYTFDANGRPTGFNQINGSYVSQSGSNQIILQGPIISFVYASNSYAATGLPTDTGHGTLLVNYAAAGGRTATAEFSQITGSLIKMIVHPANGTAVTYVDGASIGRPGAYVLSNTPSSANHLEGVNGINYTPSGDMSSKVNALVNNNGVFDINGNFMTMGIWSNDPGQSGMSLSYDDGIPTTIPATIEFTASRPLSRWFWTAATSDNTAVTPTMLVDESNRLSLYPVDYTGPDAVPPPAVVLDPSTNGVSQFKGMVRFDRPVRIAPQGDVSMGVFQHDSFPQ